MSQRNEATVVSVTRRYISICTSSGEILLGTTAKRELEPFVGDKVIYSQDKQDVSIEEIVDRKSKLSRCYFGKEKTLAANLDLLLIITAPTPLWNPAFLDRAYASAVSEGIEVAIVINKIDLDDKIVHEEQHLATYKSLGVKLFPISAKRGDNLEALLQFLDQPDFNLIALSGVSGVGKSTLLNRIVPEALHKTQTVSEKTGQGRQTTSQSLAYLYPNNQKQKFIIDLPGIQSYGVTHLTIDQVRAAFADFLPFAQQCRYLDCSHREELECGVKKALTAGQICQTRFNSYLQMREEIEKANSFD